MKIAVAGAGYVGLSVATLLAQNNEVVLYDIVEEKVEMINRRISPIRDDEIEEFFRDRDLDLRATTDFKEAVSGADYIVICTPTDYDEETNYFDTSSIEDVIEKILSIECGSENEATIVIKSTIPVGYVLSIRKKYQTERIFFSPEFLREGRALYDNLYPARIIVGDKGEAATSFAKLLSEGAKKEDVPILAMGPTEAEAVKLFANTYLALRIAFFNELDTYAEINGLGAKSIIDGVSLDPRIGDYYNNPSFGYGGYCLPKDTKQLLANYAEVPNEMIKATVATNKIRKRHIVEMILKRRPKVVGIYRLVMKSKSDNFRFSAVQDVIRMLREKGLTVVICEPMALVDEFEGCEIMRDIEHFKARVDLIVANRISAELADVMDKVYTRDIYARD